MVAVLSVAPATALAQVGAGSSGKPETDTGYKDCGSRWVNELGINFDWYENDAGEQIYDVLRIVPSRWARYLPGPTESIAGFVYNGMRKCLREHGWTVQWRSSSAMWQQIHCHIVGRPGGGSTWDIEGHRKSNWWWYLTLAPFHKCNW